MPQERTRFVNRIAAAVDQVFERIPGDTVLGIPLGDAFGQALIVRDRHGAEYRRILETLNHGHLAGRELGRFERGLYGCSEMFINGFLKLIEDGIIRREVFVDAVLQQLINDGRTADETTVTPETLCGLLDGETLRRGRHCSADLLEDKSFDCVSEHELGTRLAGGSVITGAFFLGPHDFSERRCTMPPQKLAPIEITGIDFINHLYGQGELKRAYSAPRRAS